MAFYNFVFCTNAGDEVLYDCNSDELMLELKTAVDGPNRNRTILVENEQVPVRKSVFDELVRIRSLFGRNKKVTGFEICDSFQYSKERKFSVEFLENGAIEVIRLEE